MEYIMVSIAWWEIFDMWWLYLFPLCFAFCVLLCCFAVVEHIIDVYNCYSTVCIFLCSVYICFCGPAGCPFTSGHFQILIFTDWRHQCNQGMLTLKALGNGEVASTNQPAGSWVNFPSSCGAELWLKMNLVYSLSVKKSDCMTMGRHLVLWL